MKRDRPSSTVSIGRRAFPRNEFISRLNTYNYFVKDKTNLQLNFHETGQNAMLEGNLIISWGVRRPIRLKIQDEKQSLSVTSPDPVSPHGGKRGMTRWREFDDLHHIDEMEETGQDIQTPTVSVPQEQNTSILRPVRPAALPELVVDDETASLFRTMSDASVVKKRVKTRTAAERQQAQQHRFSINGHFYNFKTSIFTPVFGTPSNVWINSKMTTYEVITQLLKKFKVINDPKEFALYCVHQSGEKRKLNDSDLPLWERFLQGPSEFIMKIFLMDRDELEVSNDVAQYLNLELPILEGVLRRLQEEESLEIERVMTKFRQKQLLLSQHLNSKIIQKTETTV